MSKSIVIEREDREAIADPVHDGRTDRIVRRRQLALDRARQRHPERFVNARRKIAGPPDKVWINPPAEPQAVA